MKKKKLTLVVLALVKYKNFLTKRGLFYEKHVFYLLEE